MHTWQYRFEYIYLNCTITLPSLLQHTHSYTHKHSYKIRTYMPIVQKVHILNKHHFCVSFIVIPKVYVMYTWLLPRFPIASMQHARMKVRPSNQTADFSHTASVPEFRLYLFKLFHTFFSICFQCLNLYEFFCIFFSLMQPLYWKIHALYEWHILIQITK